MRIKNKLEEWKLKGLNILVFELMEFNPNMCFQFIYFTFLHIITINLEFSFVQYYNEGCRYVQML